MATTRINGIRYDLTKLTAYELEALVRHTEKRHEAAHDDLDKLAAEMVRRANVQLPI